MPRNSVCLTCGVLNPKGSRGYVRKYCSRVCETAARKKRMTGNRLRVGIRPANAFTKGHATWNKSVKGIHLSPTTEFKPGQRPARTLPVGAETTRVDKQGNPRVWVKVAEPREWRPRAVVVWEEHHGPVRLGCVIHHKDRDSTNDTIENLQQMTRAEHLAEHRNDEAA